MSSVSRVSQYLNLRKSTLWQLLASNYAPYVISILQTVLYDNREDRVLKGSVIQFRVGQELDKLREQGLTELSRSPQEYLSSWVNDGYLIRRFPPGATEEEYELSAASIDAIRIVSEMGSQRVAMTESRLALVIQALQRLAEDTDPDTTRRAERLRDERARIDRELERIENGQAPVLTIEVSLERTREILDMALRLTDDFRRVLDRFVDLHNDLRKKLLVFDDSRGQVAQEVFDGIHEIEKSEAGRSFDSFYSLLTNEEQQGLMIYSLEGIFETEFFKYLEPNEQDILTGFVSTLLIHSMTVHKETTRLSKSLQNLVQSHSYRERRRLLELINQAQKEALVTKDDILPGKTLQLVFNLTSVRLSSVSQINLLDPSTIFTADPMRPADEALVDFGAVVETIKSSEIDYRTLRECVKETLKLYSPASIADILNRFPATQGLGSVVGLIHLAHRYGQRGPGHETVEWQGLDELWRQARIEKWFFFIAGIDNL
jgi:hypothetical protein